MSALAAVDASGIAWISRAPLWACGG